MHTAIRKPSFIMTCSIESESRAKFPFTDVNGFSSRVLVSSMVTTGCVTGDKVSESSYHCIIVVCYFDARHFFEDKALAKLSNKVRFHMQHCWM